MKEENKYGLTTIKTISFIGQFSTPPKAWEATVTYFFKKQKFNS